MEKIYFNLKAMPQEGRNFASPGAYQLASKIKSSVVDPGGDLIFEQYITGYGSVGASKIFSFMSDVFDVTKSTCQHSLGVKGGKLYFGKITSALPGSGFHCGIEGIKNLDWKASTSYFDIGNGDCPAIIMETKQDSAPFNFSLRIKNNALPGDYSIDFYFTYFNGEKWICNKEQVKFKVRSFLERHAAKLSWFGIMATIFSLTIATIKLFV